MATFGMSNANRPLLTSFTVWNRVVNWEISGNLF